MAWLEQTWEKAASATSKRGWVLKWWNHGECSWEHVCRSFRGNCRKCFPSYAKYFIQGLLIAIGSQELRFHLSTFRVSKAIGEQKAVWALERWKLQTCLASLLFSSCSNIVASLLLYDFACSKVIMRWPSVLALPFSANNPKTLQ